VRILEEVRKKYGFALVGYVVMPEHVHLLIGESQSVPPSKIIQVFKQKVSRQMRGKDPAKSTQPCLVFPCEIADLQRFWQRRYYDFNVYSRSKLEEKLEYMHANPVVEKLVKHPGDWPWSSWSYYETGEGLLKMDALK
jgi:putative transposase